MIQERVPRLDDLPVLGVGASLSFGMAPDPVALARMPGGPSFIEYAGGVPHALVMDPVRQLQRGGTPVLYHPSCLNLCGPDPNPPHWLAGVAAHVAAVQSAWLAQDVATCFVGPEPGYSIGLGYFVPPILNAAGLDQAVARVLEVVAAVPAPLLLEPAPVTYALGDQSIFDWIGALAERTHCGLLLDAGHLVAHQLAAGRGLLDGLDALPWHRVIEVHVAGGVLTPTPSGPRYLDAHDLPILPETWTMARALFQRAPNLRAVCVECEGAAAAAILPVLRRTRERVATGAANPALREKARAELVGEEA